MKEEVAGIGGSFGEESAAGEDCSEYNVVEYVEIGDYCANSSWTIIILNS